MIDTIVLHTALDSITLCGVDVHEVRMGGRQEQAISRRLRNGFR
ncbi:unnamed protein product [Toxocara canis]|uniref:Transposase n=1 Tax=Toxocara canis TaxID=6265 RepID=A0A183VF64_TOXCA|nr:unnamed protein product [Toxocara canis]